MITDDHRIAVVSGSAGVICRLGNDLVVLGGSAASVAAATDAISPHFQARAPRGSDLLALLDSVGDVSVAAIVSTADGVETFTTANGLVEQVEGAELTWVGIGPAPSDAIRRVDQAPHVDLRVGVVPGQGALVVGSALVAPPPFEVVDLHAPVEAAAPLPVAEAPAPVASIQAVPDPTAERADELPTGPPPAPPAHPAQPAGGSQIEVMGIRCSRNHFNNPKAAYCQVCGISMVHVTHYMVPGPRPTLGFIVFDDGATFALDRSYCVGREPTSEQGVTPLVLHDERHSVSRSHAELVLDGWDVIIRDLSSTNGTFVWNPTVQQWNRVMPDQPVTIQPGTLVAIGRKVFVYEAVARSV